MRKIIPVLLSLVLVACGGERETAAIAEDRGNGPVIVAAEPVVDARVDAVPPVEAGPTVVMLGDSLTAGYGLPADDALPVQIERALRADGHVATFVNAGVSGDTTAGGLARYDWSVASANPDLLIVALGANDYLNGIDPEQTRANLTAILERAQADALPVVLVSVEARSDAAHDPRAEAFAQIYPDLAEAFGVPHISGMLRDVRDQPDLLLPDGLHPTAEGIEIVAESLAADIAPHLPDAY